MSNRARGCRMRPGRGPEEPLPPPDEFTLRRVREKVHYTVLHVCEPRHSQFLREPRPGPPGRASPVACECARAPRPGVARCAGPRLGSTVALRSFRRTLPGLHSRPSIVPSNSPWAPQSPFSSGRSPPRLRSHASIFLRNLPWASQARFDLPVEACLRFTVALLVRTKSAWASQSRFDLPVEPCLRSAGALRSFCASPPGLHGHASPALRACNQAAQGLRDRFARASPALPRRPPLADRGSV